MQIDAFTFAAQVVNFLVLVLLLRRFLYRPVLRVMDRREERIAGRIEEARRKLVEAEEMASDYRHRLIHLEQDREEMMEAARREAEESRREWIREARREVRKMQDRWRESVDEERAAYLRELRQATGERLVALLGRVLEDLSTQSLPEQVAGRFLERLAGLDPEERARLQAYGKEAGAVPVEVRTSFDPGDTLKQELPELLDEAFGRQMNYRWEQTERPRMGLEVRAGGWKLAWNLDAYLDHFQEDLEGRMKEILPERVGHRDKSGEKPVADPDPAREGDKNAPAGGGGSP